MFKFSAKSLIVSLSLVCLPLVGNATTSDTATSAKSSPRAFHLSCKKEDFVGEVKGHYYNYGIHKTVYIKQYRITKAGGSNRHKANVNMTVANLKGGGSKKHNSADRMRQDGQWNPVDLRVEAPYSSAQIRVQIIFDKSGADTACTTMTNI